MKGLYLTHETGLGIKHSAINPKNFTPVGQIIFKLIKSQKDTFYTIQHFCELISMFWALVKFLYVISIFILTTNHVFLEMFGPYQVLVDGRYPVKLGV